MTAKRRPARQTRTLAPPFRWLVAPLVACGACAGLAELNPFGSDAPKTPMDIHSHARPDEVRVTHVSLDLTADFEAKTLSGHAVLDLERTDPDAPLKLDAHGLAISSVTSVTSVNVDVGAPRSWRVVEPDPILGPRFEIDLEPGDVRVRIDYRTRPSAEALQWLAPEQTDGGEQPFLFTQGQAILTRTWIPLQDTPGVRFTYDATIRVPEEALSAVMSAEQREVVDKGVFRFRMRKPIPSYLIALAIGDLDVRDISERCAIWAERTVVDRAAKELDDTEAMLSTCEGMFGPYRWGRYDVLILPPSFPFGGMENPCLTFATPTILAGDKSLVALIAHELAHSWSGNLVTNATWRDFWLNEGFTVYLEQRIMAALYGVPRARMEILIGLQKLEEELAELPQRDQVLHVDLAGRNPDDGMTAVPYDKGAAFLRRLEQAFGRDRFDRFLAQWFDEHAFQSVTTADFLLYLDEKLLRDAPEDVRASIDVAAWVRGPGLPADCPRPESPAFDVVAKALAAFVGGAAASSLDTADWATMQWLHFLNNMPKDLAPERLADLDRAFALTGAGNSEIVAAWLELSIEHGYRGADARLEQFLLEVGRRKFVKPLYEALARTADGKARALAIYGKARPRYHAVTTRTVDGILGWSSD